MIRKTLLALIGILSFIEGTSQFCPPGTKWTFRIFTTFAGEYQYRWEAVGDTLIEGSTYTMVVANSGADILFVRRDSLKLYYYQQGRENLFFDFGADLSDTFSVDLRGSYGTDTVYRDVPIGAAQRFYRRDRDTDSVLTVRFRPGQSSMENGVSLRLLIDPAVPLHPGSALTNFQTGGPDASITFYCYEEPGGYSFTYTAECHTVSVKEVSIEKGASAYPNPAGKLLTISAEGHRTAISGVRVYDVKGELVTTMAVANATGSCEIDVELLKKGTYFLLIEWVDSTRSSRRVVIE